MVVRCDALQHDLRIVSLRRSGELDLFCEGLSSVLCRLSRLLGCMLEVGPEWNSCAK